MRLAAAFFLLTFTALYFMGTPMPQAAEEKLASSANEAGKEGKTNPKPQVKSKNPENGSVQVSTDRLEVNDKKREVTLIGKVMIRWEDVVLTCDRAKILYREIKTEQKQPEKSEAAPTGLDQGQNPGAGDEVLSHEIVRIEAEGHVKIARGDQVALSGRAIYKPQPRVIILTDSPQVWRGKDLLTGSRITIYLDQDRSVVESGPDSRVNATFY